MAIETFHDQWMGQSVLVASGPFKGTRGTVQASANPNVKVALPGPLGSVLWFRSEDLEITHGELVSKAL